MWRRKEVGKQGNEQIQLEKDPFPNIEQCNMIIEDDTTLKLWVYEEEVNL